MINGIKINEINVEWVTSVKTFSPSIQKGRPGEGVPGVLARADAGLEPVDELLAVEGEHPEVVGIPLRTARGGQGIRVAVQVRLNGVFA